MIRLATIQNAGTVGRLGFRQLAKARLASPSSALASRSFSAAKDDEKPKGIPYSKVTVGVPKETFPLEKRVAATPEVRSCDLGGGSSKWAATSHHVHAISFYFLVFLSHGCIDTDTNIFCRLYR